MAGLKGPFGKDSSDDRIQDEIRRRILEEARQREAIRESKDATQATLDALEELVSLSREEMERIAEEVKAEFSGEQLPDEATGRGGSMIPWIFVAMLIVGFFGFRRGHPWMMVGGAVLLIILISQLLSRKK